ncbi:hypothetical protein CDD83_10897 [Cordyceps sp. RAO-2017]|nr:hypothetical protein CDD83_10897 [Cordyceps sp. RAO-2017]
MLRSIAANAGLGLVLILSLVADGAAGLPECSKRDAAEAHCPGVSPGRGGGAADEAAKAGVEKRAAEEDLASCCCPLSQVKVFEPDGPQYKYLECSEGEGSRPSEGTYSRPGEAALKQLAKCRHDSVVYARCPGWEEAKAADDAEQAAKQKGSEQAFADEAASNPKTKDDICLPGQGKSCCCEDKARIRNSDGRCQKIADKNPWSPPATADAFITGRRKDNCSAEGEFGPCCPEWNQFRASHSRGKCTDQDEYHSAANKKDLYLFRTRNGCNGWDLLQEAAQPGFLGFG